MRSKGWFSLIAFLAVALSASAQSERNDSIPVGIEFPDTLHLDTPSISSGLYASPAKAHKEWFDPESPASQSVFDQGQHPSLTFPSYDFTPGQAVLFNWNNGAVVASGAAANYFGLMRMETGALGIYQSFGRFSLYAGGIANKYGYFRGVTTQYGVNGNLTYTFSPRLSITAFGSYYFDKGPYMSNGMPMQPAMVGYYGQSAFGATVDYSINDHWGVEAGAQAVQQPGTRKYQMEPIATPYYKIGKVKIGLPVGQILYHLIKDRPQQPPMPPRRRK